MTNCTYRWFVVGALVLSVATACGGGESDPPEGDVVGIVTFADTGDPVAEAEVTPLVASETPDAAVVFGEDPNNDRTATDGRGQFGLEYRVEPPAAGIQVTVEVPTGEGDGVGRFDWRDTIDLTTDEPAEFAIPRPEACEDGAYCGAPMLPDLVPIVDWSQLAPEVESRLRPPTDGPAASRLLPATSWFVEEADDRRLLRFATVAANLGSGPLDVIALPSQDGAVAPTVQRIWTDEWKFGEIASGEFLHHPGHDHIHFDAFERYRLLGSTGDIVASSEKVSFCLRDSVLVAEERPDSTGPMVAARADCGTQQQVINPGFGDHYNALLEDQWIDVTGVPAGVYTLEITVDPLNRIVESDETNNVGSIEIELS